MVSASKNVLSKVSAGETENFTGFLDQARQSLANMEKWILSPEAMQLSEDAVEREIERQGRETQRLVLHAHIAARGSGRMEATVQVVGPTGNTETRKAEREDTRTVVSLFGAIEVKRTAYTTRGKETVHPLDEELNLPCQSLSYEMQQRLIKEVIRGPFDEAVQAMQRNTGNVIAKRTAQQVTVNGAADFDAFYAQRKAQSPEATGPILVAAADCKGVPVVKPKGAVKTVRRKKGEKPNKKKMATVAAVFTQKPRVRTPEDVVESLFESGTASPKQRLRPENKRVWASLAKEKAVVFDEIKSEMEARDPSRQKIWTLVTDGERILERLGHTLGKNVIFVLDFLHVLERLWLAAHAFFGEGTPEAENWVRKHALMVLRGEVSQVIKGMRQSATKRRLKGSIGKSVRNAATYFRKNRHRMRYNVYLAKGLPIASGAVEGACKNLVKDRMERSGMRWQIVGAEAVIKLRAIFLSGDMGEYWNFHMFQEKRRLYDRWMVKAAS